MDHALIITYRGHDLIITYRGHDLIITYMGHVLIITYMGHDWFIDKDSNEYCFIVPVQLGAIALISYPNNFL